MKRTGSADTGPSTGQAGPHRRSLPDLSALLLAMLPIAGLAVFNPVGWDRFGPIRWFALPAIGLAAVVLRREDIAWDRSWPTGLWAALLGWGALASVVAVDPLHAWIGTPDRRFGWLTWLLCGALFLVALQAGDPDDDVPGRTDEPGVIRARERMSHHQPIGVREAVVRGFAIGSCAMGGYALVELAGWTSVAGFGDRLGGPFGQPAFLGAASVLAAPTCGGLALSTTTPLRWRLAGGLGAAGAVFTLLAAQSRAAWLGALVAGSLWLAINGRALIRATAGPSPDPDRQTQTSSGDLDEPAVEAALEHPASPSPKSYGVAVALGAVGILAVLTIEGLRERLSSATGADGVVQGRLDEWRVGIRALGDSPLVGYGPEGYRTVFGRHVDQQYVVDWGREVITDRAHGGLLDVGLALGLPGALIYLGLILLVLRGAVLAVANGEPIRAGLAVGVIGYLVQQQFLFPLSELDPVFWLAAGLVLAPSIRIATPAPTAFRSAMAGLAVGLAVVVAAAGALDLTADSLTTAAIEDGDLSAPTSLRPDSIRYRFIASRVAGQDGDRRRALQHIEDGLRRSPADPALRGEQARLLLDIARADDGPSRSTRLVVALAALEALVADDPLHPEHLQRLGVARALTEDYDGAIEALEQAMTLAPDRPDIVQNLAEVIRLRDDR